MSMAPAMPLMAWSLKSSMRAFVSIIMPLTLPTLWAIVASTLADSPPEWITSPRYTSDSFHLPFSSNFWIIIGFPLTKLASLVKNFIV